ncbi:SAVED domain-containing protein [Paenibacillus naphthalenovorans]|uniref:SAVED domain-containing protein n=1 Tax=Paenibacillus naphthalenovorans TaxID=162209 RepID=UPI0020C90090|nr:SAVED domain-containing protein [Paenibacillus naphthalenovorans]
MLWGKAAGRCQYRGCNELLHIDPHTKSLMNRSYIAHIIADSPGGPRGDKILSPKLAKDISNLMLLCDTHHRLIDVKDVDGHPVELLQAMKQEHEKRIELVTQIQEDRQSQIVLYGSNIGDHSYPISYERSVVALLPERYPADTRAIELGWKNSLYNDHEDDFWKIENENLKRQVQTKLIPLLSSGACRHLSLFALAPQPLLISLGTMLSDIFPVDVYQLQREPVQRWGWDNESDNIEFLIQSPEKIHPTVALNISLSATIATNRITEVLGDNVSIWTLTIKTPNNDFMKSKSHLVTFRQTIRSLMDRIKLAHGQNNRLNIFPAMAVSTAVELGRIWMPKADLPLVIYDQNKKTNKFELALEISKNNEVVLHGSAV